MPTFHSIMKTVRNRFAPVGIQGRDLINMNTIIFVTWYLFVVVKQWE